MESDRYTPPPNIGPRSSHGIRATYARGCRCRTEDGLFRAPQTTGCTEAWREARRVKVAEYRQRQCASHPEGCMCYGCQRIRGER